MNRARHGRCAQSGRAEIIRRSQDGAANTTASGEVYNLHSISDFKGLYAQSSGGPALVESGASDLWLRNAAGVVLHLKGTQEGVSLSLGREEILIEMHAANLPFDRIGRSAVPIATRAPSHTAARFPPFNAAFARSAVARAARATARCLTMRANAGSERDDRCCSPRRPRRRIEAMFIE